MGETEECGGASREEERARQIVARFWTEPSSGRSQSASTVSIGSRRSLQAAAGVRLPHRFRGKGELRKNDDGLLLRRDHLHVAISHSERHRRRGGARVARVRPLSSVRRHERVFGPPRVPAPSGGRVYLQGRRPLPIWICIIGAVIFVLAAVSICIVSTPCGKCYLCLYSPILMILSIAILFGTIVLYLASRTIKSSDFQEVTILGYELTDKMEGLWIKGVIDDTAAMCELQEVVQCSGFYDDQCLVPPTGNFTQAQVLAACPARSQIFKSTGQFGGTTDNATLSEISASAGYDVGVCLESEVENEAVGCLRSLSEILYQLGNVLFIPGLVLGGYFLVLSLISSYMTCCTLCGGKI